MDEAQKTIVWQQFGAAIDMLDDALSFCPDRLWTAAVWSDSEDARYGQFWFIAYHALRWLDLYLAGPADPAEFAAPPPFVTGALPDEPYTKADVRTYLRECRHKCQTTIEALTDERAREICTWEQPYFRLQLMSMRHVQEHASQLNLFLGQNGIAGPDWVAAART